MKPSSLVFVLLIAALIVTGCAPVSSTPNPASAAAAEHPVASATNSHKILLMPREVSDNMDLMISKEVGVMVPMLKEAGYDVVIASASGKPLVGITYTLPVDMPLVNVNVNDYAGYVIPCMAAGSTGVIPPEFLPVVQKAMATGRPMAIQQSAAQILYTAGVLKGKTYASQYDLPGATNVGKGVVQDGNLISSAVCPNLALPANGGLEDGTTELMQKFIAALNHKG